LLKEILTPFLSKFNNAQFLTTSGLSIAIPDEIQSEFAFK